MPTMFSNREFNQDIGRVKRAADEGPVIITDRGTPKYVLLRHDAYRRLLHGGPNMLDMLAMPGVEDIDLDIPLRKIETLRTIDFDA